jgi:hypothetical protein
VARNPRITQGDLLAAIHATPRVQFVAASGLSAIVVECHDPLNDEPGTDKVLDRVCRGA